MATTPMQGRYMPSPAQKENEMWQPIETAPKDQTFLAVLNCAGQQTICTMRWEVAEAKNNRPDHSVFHRERVTHWMPLPALPGAQPAPSFADAYQGAMEEVAIWKRRALEAETLNRKFIAGINSPMHMGEPAQPAQKAVAYLDLGVGGYMDIGTDLTDEALATIPKGRHMLGIVGTYGVEGYSPAQPAPSVPEGWKLVPIEPTPTALLVAVANLVAQMEIVSRVGFVDTPNDKDSCAAFCVAEGTWLELMSAVESLASALADAPEAKP